MFGRRGLHMGFEISSRFVSESVGGFFSWPLLLGTATNSNATHLANRFTARYTDGSINISQWHM